MVLARWQHILIFPCVRINGSFWTTFSDSLFNFAPLRLRAYASKGSHPCWWLLWQFVVLYYIKYNTYIVRIQQAYLPPSPLWLRWVGRVELKPWERHTCKYIYSTYSRHIDIHPIYITHRHFCTVKPSKNPHCCSAGRGAAAGLNQSDSSHLLQWHRILNSYLSKKNIYIFLYYLYK